MRHTRERWVARGRVALRGHLAPVTGAVRFSLRSNSVVAGFEMRPPEFSRGAQGVDAPSTRESELVRDPGLTLRRAVMTSTRGRQAKLPRQSKARAGRAYTVDVGRLPNRRT